MRVATARQTVARRQAPLSQNSAMTIPRAMAVTDRASQMPRSPMAPDHHAASGRRSRGSVVVPSCGPDPGAGMHPEPAPFGHDAEGGGGGGAEGGGKAGEPNVHDGERAPGERERRAAPQSGGHRPPVRGVEPDQAAPPRDADADEKPAA